jgi:hypothetical protein
MSKRTRRTIAGLAIAVGLALSGCSGSGGNGIKSNGQIRAVDVATNVVDTANNVDTATVLVNGGASYEGQPYGTASRYLYVQSGIQGFAVSTTMTLPTLTQPATTGGTLPTTTTVQPPQTAWNIANGGLFTAYIVGRPDVPNPTQVNLSDLDPRLLNVVVLRDDTQVAATAGHATVRVLNAICSPQNATTPGAVDVYINGTAVYSGVAYATKQTPPATADQQVPAGTVSVSVNIAGTGTVLVPPTPITLAAGSRYTLVADEPTAITQPGVVPPTPPAASTTYGLTLVPD